MVKARKVIIPNDDDQSEKTEEDQKICDLFGCEPDMKCRQVGRNCSPSNPEECVMVCDVPVNTE